MSDESKPSKDSVVSVWEIMRYIQADRFMSKKEVAEYLTLSVRSLEKQLHLMPRFRVGKKLVFKKSEVDKWMETRRESNGYLGPPRTPDGEIDLDEIAYRAMYKVLGPERANESRMRSQARRESKRKRDEYHLKEHGCTRNEYLRRLREKKKSDSESLNQNKEA